MRLAVVGAESFIASEIIPFLAQQQFDIVVIGHDPSVLGRRYPEAQAFGFEDLSESFLGVDAVVYAASKSAEPDGDTQEMITANVHGVEQALAAAKTVNVRQFVHLSTVHLFRSIGDDAYLKSRREAEALVKSADGIKATVLRLAAVYGSEFRGNLSVLDKCPKFLRPVVFQVLKGLRPTAHAQGVARAIHDAIQTQEAPFQLLAVSDAQQGNTFYAITKRLMDLVFSALVIFLLWWLLLILWLAVKLTSDGPGLLAQKRVGQDGKVFTCYKYRTMYQGTRQAGSHELGADSITSIGRFLRRTKADELPQIINLVKNEMSLIGPRPCLPVQRELIEARRAAGVLSVVPGISGWAQIQNIDMSEPQRLAQVDAQYVALRCLSMDISIAISTLRGRGQGDKTKAVE